MVRAEVVSARPRVTEGSREGMEGPKGASIWCDVFRACASGEEAAAASRTGVSKSSHGSERKKSFAGQGRRKLARGTARACPYPAAPAFGESVLVWRRFEDRRTAEERGDVG
jgi:hypothetical protein